MNKHLEQSVELFRNRSGQYARTDRYYAGEHDLAFATDKFKNAFGTLFREFALNLCPAICDAVRDKLRVTGFSVESEPANAATDIARECRRIWLTNRMGTRAGEVHKEALKSGDAYVIVWPDAAGRAVIYPNRAGSCAVIYDDEQPGKVVRAAKYWHDSDKRTRLNLFYPDRIEKFVTRPDTASATLAAGEFVSAGAAVPNPYDCVPVFHFANNADIGSPGRSELEPAIPIQDGLNKSILDMLVAMEFAAYRQRWAAGIEIEYDSTGVPIPPFTAGIDHVWMSQSPETKFGDFGTANLEQFLKVKDGFRVDLASVTGTPLHYFTPTLEGMRSGISMARSETRFLGKVRDRQESFGQVWADAISFALTIEGVKPPPGMLTQWEDPAPMSVKETLENIAIKRDLGLTAEQALIEAGYGAADVRQMISAENKAAKTDGDTNPAN